ncbi:hypothetical protein IT413_06530 [Candidatus Peregrinibacteria bacterium]|nr:hypothetical protein [Candidatus Peregrinibacteria bacterium]
MFEKDFLRRGKARTSAYVLTSRIVQLMSWFAIVAAALLVVMFFTFRTAHASSATCYDITGESSEVLVGSIPNSGVLHFDNPTYVPALQYQACVEDTSLPLGDGPFQLKGWAWDTNLGWISFYCDDENGDGAPYENLGVSCGNQIYGVTMEGVVPTGGTTSGQLRGYAWGDNSGWINFSCAGGSDALGNACGGFDYGVTAETVDTACYGEVYGSPSPSGSCSDNLPEDTFIFAWSDSVGWFDFTGVQFPWIDLIDAGVVVSAYLDPDPSVPGYTPPVADGTDAYKLRLVVTKTSGAAITPEDYDFDISLAWPQNCIDLNQTNTVSDCNAVSVPLTESDFNLTSAGVGGYGQDGVANAFTVYIPSFAPTSDQNGYTFTAGGFFPYETFVEGDPNSGVPIPANELQIGQLSVAVMRAADGVCAFGDDYATCTQYPVTNFGAPFLGYQPAVDVPMLDNQTTETDTIQAAYKIGQTINYLTACRGTFAGSCGGANVAFAMGVDTPEFQFVADFASGTPDTDATCADPTTFAIPTNLAWNTGSPAAFIVTPVFQADGTDPSGCKQTGPTTGEGAYLYSTITYTNGGNAISYFSNKLPRVTGTLVVNPVADVKGSVYSTGVTNPQEGTSVRSIGDVSTNILRDAVFRNVSNIIAGAEDKSANDFSEIYPSGTGFGMASTACVDLLKTDAFVTSAHAFYCKGDVHIHGTPAGTNVTWTGQRTIISVGGDIYIDDNLYNGAAVSSKPRLGIIALKDFDTGKGGNVYIHPDVTDIQANIFTDGSVYSYDGNSSNINSAGEPCWASEKTRHDTLINQLYIEGSIASQNTIGGAADVTPTLGNGKKASAAEGTYGGSSSTCSPSGRSQARLYDLNFLRYYGLVFERLDAASACPGQAKDQQFPLTCPGEPGYSIQATQVSAGGDLVLPSDLGTAVVSQYLATQAGDHLNAVYVYFDPPPSTLPGFGVTGGVDMTVRPR